jgi:hypothetical protein
MRLSLKYSGVIIPLVATAGVNGKVAFLEKVTFSSVLRNHV